jgi:hypothetical protein
LQALAAAQDAAVGAAANLWLDTLLSTLGDALCAWERWLRASQEFSRVCLWKATEDLRSGVMRYAASTAGEEALVAASEALGMPLPAHVLLQLRQQLRPSGGQIGGGSGADASSTGGQPGPAASAAGMQAVQAALSRVAAVSQLQTAQQQSLECLQATLWALLRPAVQALPYAAAVPTRAGAGACLAGSAAAQSAAHPSWLDAAATGRLEAALLQCSLLLRLAPCPLRLWGEPCPAP